MRRYLLAVLYFSTVSFCLAQQPHPVIIDGAYDKGSSMRQPYENIAANEELKQTLSQISDAFNNNDLKSVIDMAQSLLNKGLNTSKVYTAMAMAYEKQNNFDDALYYASQAIAKQPSNVEAYTTRAYSYYKKGDMLRAQEDIEIALKLNPKSRRAEDVRAEIMTDSLVPKKPKRNKGSSIPPWFFVYIGCVVLVMIVLMTLRYRKLMRGAIDERGRQLKEINIKDQYDFIRQIGEGGMGKVYEAYDNALKRKVAVKRIRPELLKNSYVREQFLIEARTVAMLHHPCIVEIYTVLETVNSLYLVFEYVEGQTLETRLDIDGYLELNQVRDIFGYVCKGLIYAHHNNIVHCDLKPGNIMISDSGTAKIMDFGVARKAVGEDKSDLRTVAGTPAYMSPEQQKGFTSKQSDIYSLAVCLYESLVGSIPWTVSGFDVVSKKIIPPSAMSKSVPKIIDQLIIMSLNEDPAKRIQTVEEFWDILKTA